MAKTKSWSSSEASTSPTRELFEETKSTKSYTGNPYVGGAIVKIQCAMYRDGTSKPIFFLENDLPKDVKKREQVVLEAFGTPDVRQIDGWVEPTH